MTNITLMCPAASGHLNPMLPLGKELQRRNHYVTFVGFLDAKPKVETAGLEFRAIGELEFPAGAIANEFSKIGKKSGLAALKLTLNSIRQTTIVRLEQAPAVLREIGTEILVIDQVCSGGKAIAELLDIPFISTCGALPLNREPGIPPFNTHWQYSRTFWARLRNRLGYAFLDQIGNPIRQTVAEYRQSWGLSLPSNPNQSYSSFAQISQEPAEFEFPREQLPNCFHFTGPYHSTATRQEVAFPWEKLTGKPLIYASMGTIQNRQQEIFYSIAKACTECDADVVISLGGSCRPEDLAELPGSPIVVEYAPQLELLEKATLTITHAGQNTVLESLTYGVPMVAIPITNDQPGVGARIVWTGTGEVIPLKRLRDDNLSKAIQQVLNHSRYRENARKLQRAISQSGGVNQAANIVEQVAKTGKPVYRTNY